jgi:predicted permease
VLLEPVIPARGIDKPQEVKIAIWLGGLSALVLMIACANVTNLLLARAWTRHREIAIRLSIGATARRLARQMLTESVLLATLGAAGALLLAAIGGRVLESMFVNAFPAADGRFVDARLFAFTAAVALGTGVLVSLVPVFQSRAPDLTNALKASPSVGGGRSSRVRAMLLVTQSAFCLVLLVVAALFAQSLRRVEGLDLGVDLERTIVARFNMRTLAVPEAELNANYAAIVARAREIPGVTRAALGVDDPFSGGGWAVNIHTPARSREMLDWTNREKGLAPMMVAVDSGFFRTVRARLHGRDFESTDVRGAERVVIINQPVAEFLFPGEDPLGQCVYLPTRASAPSENCATVVGVLQGFWYRSITERSNLVVYIAMAQRPPEFWRPGALFVHSTGDPATTMQAMREAILSVRPDLPTLSIQRLIDVAEPQLKPWRLAATMFSIFGAVALVIAVVGLYAVVSFAATQRSNEIAVRLALGARAYDIIRAVGVDGMRALVVGLAIGVLCAIAIRGWIGPLLFQTSPDDPVIIGSVAALLLGVAVVAMFVPTARALRVSPATALRSE